MCKPFPRRSNLLVGLFSIFACLSLFGCKPQSVSQSNADNQPNSLDFSQDPYEVFLGPLTDQRFTLDRMEPSSSAFVDEKNFVLAVDEKQSCDLSLFPQPTKPQLKLPPFDDPMPESMFTASSVPPIDLQPPSTWQAPPSILAVASNPSTEPNDGLPDWPKAWTRSEGVILYFRVYDSPTFRYDLLARRVDARTGKPTTAPVTLKKDGLPNAVAYTPETLKLYGEQLLAAFDPDGERLATTDPSRPGQLDLFDAKGKLLDSFRVDDSSNGIEWIAWPRPDRMLVLVNKRLRCIDPTTKVFVYELEDLRIGLPRIAFGSSWFAIWKGEYGYVVDVETGKCLCRLDVAGWGAHAVELSVSPNGRYVAACLAPTPLPQERPMELDQRKLPYSGTPCGTVVWDLATGAAFWKRHMNGMEDRVGVKRNHIGWYGDSIMVAEDPSTGKWDVYDVRLSTTLQQSHGSAPSATFRTSPDGRIWFSEFRDKGNGTSKDQGRIQFLDKQQWNEMAIPNVTSSTAPFLDRSLPLFSPGQSGLRIEAKCANRRSSEHLARGFSEVLQSRGIPIKPDGLSLELDLKITPSKEVLRIKDKRSGSGKIPFPVFHLSYELKQPNGEVIRKGEYAQSFMPEQSKYSTGQMNMRNRLDQPIKETTFNFGNLDPLDALIEDGVKQIATAMVRNPAFATTSFIQLNGQWVDTPLRIEVRFPTCKPFHEFEWRNAK